MTAASTVSAQLRAAGFATGVRHYPGRTFHHARRRVGLHIVGVVHAGEPRGLVAFEHTLTGRAGYIVVPAAQLAATARAAVAGLADGRFDPVGFNGLTRPLPVRFPDPD